MVAVPGSTFFDHSHLGRVSHGSRAHAAVIEEAGTRVLLSTPCSCSLLLNVGLDELLIQITISAELAALYAGAHELAVEAQRLLQVAGRTVVAHLVFDHHLVLLGDGGETVR